MAKCKTSKPRVKESSVRVKKRVKRGVKKGMKRVKSAPPEAYLAGAGLLVGTTAVVLLATTKRGQELLVRTAQLALQPEAEEEEEEQEQESDVQEDVRKKPAKAAQSEEEEVDEDTNGDEESEVTDLKPRDQRPPSPRKAPPQKASTA
jgi:hypothetical protein